jgi:hypothetical protein
MRDRDHGRETAQHGFDRAFEVLRVEGDERFVEHEELRLLQQSAREENALALTVRELPPSLPHDLEESRGHSIEQLAQSRLAAHGFRELELGPCRGPIPTHERIERPVVLNEREPPSAYCTVKCLTAPVILHC